MDFWLKEPFLKTSSRVTFFKLWAWALKATPIKTIQAKLNTFQLLIIFSSFWVKFLIEKEGKENYVIGGEESFGLMIGDKVRDKDAVSAVALLCEMAAYEKNKGRSLFEKMVDLYVEYGFFKEDLISITKKGMDGQHQIAAMMEGYRSDPPKTINGSPVVKLLDYEISKGKNPQTGEKWTIDLPKSNVLQFVLADGSLISARPSGTEPKIKFYFSIQEKLVNAADFDKVNKQLDDKLKAIIADMKL